MSRYGCPKCASEHVASVERLLGTVDGHFDSTGEFQGHDDTEINWDSAETTGYQCQSCLHPFKKPALLREYRITLGQQTVDVLARTKARAFAIGSSMVRRTTRSKAVPQIEELPAGTIPSRQEDDE